jgi:hypothetical protein
MVNLRVVRLWVSAILMALGVLGSSHGEPQPVAPVTWLIFVDDLHIAIRDTGYVRKLLGSIGKELMGDGDSFVVRSSGPSSLSTPLGSNRAALDTAVSRMTGNELIPSDCLAVEADDEMRNRAELAGTAAAEMLNSLPKETRGRTMVPFTRYAAARAAMLYISDGYPRFPAAASITALPRIAQQSVVRVFALNPRALPRTPGVAPSSTPAMARCYRDDLMMKSLRAIAEPTGGFAVLEAADFADALQRIGRAMR